MWSIQLIMFIFSAFGGWFLGEKIKTKRYKNKYKGRKKYLQETFIPRDEVVVGARDYDYFDHEECGYENSFIDLTFGSAEVTYDFSKSFSDNNKEGRFKEIDQYIKKNYPQFENNLDFIIENEIIPTIIETNKKKIWVINKMNKTRIDCAKRPECGYLSINLCRMDIRTAKLIDRIYIYFRNINPEPLEVNFKTNKHITLGPKRDKKDTAYKLDRDINEISCFITDLFIKGFIIKREDGYKIFINEAQNYSYSLPISTLVADLDKFNHNGHINGYFLIDKIIKLLNDLKIYDQEKGGKFTDVCISYQNGIHIEILSYLIVDNFKFINSNLLIPFDYDNVSRRVNKDNSPYTENAISYILNLITKAKNNKLGTITLKQ